MMDQVKIKTELDRWLVEFVEASNPALGTWPPCPVCKSSQAIWDDPGKICRSA